MIVTPTQVREAEAACRQQRRSFQPLLQIDATKATPREIEHFTKEVDAIKRASALAESEPGKTFFVCAATRFATCKVERSTVQYIK